MVKVSVIVPLYNKGRFIARALDSICGQTFADFEVVVVDDGSTDDGVEVVKSYSDPRIRLIQQANAGPGAARNRGARESTAPYLAFLDADDEWLPDFLRVSMEALDAHPQCEVSVTSRYEGPARKDVTHVYVRRGVRAGTWSLSQCVGDTDPWRRWPMWYMGAVVCNRTAFEKLGGFYEKNRALVGEDTYLWIQLSLNCRVFVILSPLVWYHTEASDLGWHWRDAPFQHPQLSDPETIRRNCPNEYRHLLENRLAQTAFRGVAGLCERQDLAKAVSLLRAYPAIRRSVWNRVRLGIMMRFPKAYRMFRRTKAAIYSFARVSLRVFDTASVEPAAKTGQKPQ